MAFIVSIFKYLILLVCFVLLVGVVLLAIAALDPSGPLTGVLTPAVIAAAAASLTFLIINLGAIAILISLHDRHREIAEGVNRIAEAIEAANNSNQAES